MLLLSFSNVKEKEERKGEQAAAGRCTRGVVFLFFELDARVPCMGTELTGSFALSYDDYQCSEMSVRLSADGGHCYCLINQVQHL